MKLEKIAVADLVLDPSNARKHDSANLEAIAGSLTQFGQRKPIVISQDNTVVAGNGTLTAAKRLGWDTIEAVRIPKEWTANQIKAFALADNRTAELAAWDAEVMARQIIELEESGFTVAEFGFVQAEDFDVDLADTFDVLGREKGDIEQITFTLHSDQANTIREGLETAKGMGEYGETGNKNSNGNAIARIVELWLGTQNVG
tara:strand:- start:1129 stop:1734 length:606 start_codon:yes stop_codon:yes gene_type:complete